MSNVLLLIFLTVGLGIVMLEVFSRWDKVVNKIYEIQRGTKRLAHKVIKPVQEVVIYIKNFYGRISKQAGK